MTVDALGAALDTEHWLESPSGFPPGGVGTEEFSEPNAVVTTARGIDLVCRQILEVLAFTEYLAGRAIPAQDRLELEGDIVDAFEDSPKHATRFLRGVAGGVRRIGSMHPVERAQRRLQALTTTYVTEDRRQADGEELSPVMEVVSRYNPMLRHWPSTGVVLVADAVTARVAQHRLVFGLLGRDVDDPDGLSRRLLERTEHCGRLEIAELAASEVRLLMTRAWLRDMGTSALERLRHELAPAVASALDVDIVVQQVAYRAAMAQAG